MSPAEPAIDVRKAPIIKVLLPFILGILVRDILALQTREEIVCLAALGCWPGLCIFFLRSGMERRGDHLVFSLWSVLLFLGAGYLTGGVTAPEKPLLPAGQRVIVRGEVLQVAVTDSLAWSMDFNMDMLVQGDTLQVKQTTLKTYGSGFFYGELPGTGERWQLSGTLHPISNRGNPGEADYEKIMARKGCWYRLYIDRDTRLNRRVEGPGRQRFSVSVLREQIAGYWSGNQESGALLRAVCLGDRSGLTDDQKQSYQNAGGMHLLAVSGLHIGLIWWFLHRVFSIFVRLFRREVYRTLPLVLLLWMYAYLTGFSSSVCRAVTMFTLFSLALLIEQRTHPLNCLLISAFLMLAVDPHRIREVGFQLSYLALFGIVILFPQLRMLPGISKRGSLIRWVWEATSVSIAAQVSTAPLVIYYFHQLPVYALLTNLIAVPLLSLLIAMFVVAIPLFSLDLFIHPVSQAMQVTAMLLNRTMELISGFPGAVIRQLTIDRATLIMLLFMGLLGMLGVRKGARWPRYGLIISIAGILAWGSIVQLKARTSNSLVVCHFSRGSLVLVRQGRRVDCHSFTRDTGSGKQMIHYLASAWESSGYKTLLISNGDSVASVGRISACHPVSDGCWMLGNDLFRGWIITGKPGAPESQWIIQHPGAFVILRENPGWPFPSIHEISVQTAVIADGSNSRGYISSVKAVIPQIHSTSHLGAYRRTW